jgi:hypothetical protein
MRRLLLSATAVVLGLAMITGTADAKGGKGGGSKGGSRMDHGRRGDHRHGRHHHRHRRYWWGERGCYCYYYPEWGCYVYWDASCNEYVPISQLSAASLVPAEAPGPVTLAAQPTNVTAAASATAVATATTAAKVPLPPGGANSPDGP